MLRANLERIFGSDRSSMGNTCVCIVVSATSAKSGKDLWMVEPNRKAEVKRIREFCPCASPCGRADSVVCWTDLVRSTLETFSLVREVHTFLLLHSELGWRKTNIVKFPGCNHRLLQLTDLYRKAVKLMAECQERRQQKVGARQQQDVGLIWEEWATFCPTRYRRNICRGRTVLKVPFVKEMMGYLIMNALVIPQ